MSKTLRRRHLASTQGRVSDQLPDRLASACAWTSTPCCTTIARAVTSRPLVTIRASSILTRPLDTPEIQIHTSSRLTGTCMLASAYTITLPSLLAYPQTRVPAPSVPGPCADDTVSVPQPMARLLSKAFRVCVYYCRTYDKAVCGGGGGQ
jgi:hypothetical protein